jgi:signal transduction histidine kinase
MVRPRLGPHLRDAVLALVLVAVTLLDSADLYFAGPAQQKQVLPYFGDVAGLHRALGIWWLFGCLIIAGIVILHRWPMVALVGVGVGGLGHQWDARFAVQPLDLAVPIVLGVVAGSARSRWVPGVALAVMVLGEYLVRSRNEIVSDGKLSPPNGALPSVANEPLGTALLHAATGSFEVVLVLVLAVAIGDGVRSHRNNLRMLELRAADLEREQHQRAELATAAERARISREMHDVVAHSLSVIVAQAQGAAAALDHHPSRAATALQHVIDTGRGSLAEMRRLLGVVRGAPGAPGVAGIPALVDQMCAAGLLARLSVEGDRVPLPASVDLSAYRIVQEALTNALKHAGAGTNVAVRLVFADDALDVDVTDDGHRGDGVMSTNGHGLRGIAERVHLLGGDVAVGPVGAAGFQVRARLPVDVPSAVDS